MGRVKEVCMPRRCLLLCLSVLVVGCTGAGAGVTSPSQSGPPVLAFMVMVGNVNTGAYGAATASTQNAATSNAYASCGSFCALQGICAYSSVLPTSATWGAFASSGSVMYLGQRQYLWGYGCGQSQAEAVSKAVTSCQEPGYSCHALVAYPLVN